MSILERHRWCMEKIIEAFGPELTAETVQTFIRIDANLQKFNSFFKGDSSGRLFVFYQPVMNEGEVRKFIYSLLLSSNFICEHLLHML